MPRGIPNSTREVEPDERVRSTVDDRAEVDRTERRRRREDASLVDPSLARFRVPGSILDPQRYVYRAVRDDGMRLHQHEENDYEFMQRDEEVDGERRIRYQHGSADGKPQFTYLMRKPKEWAADDRQRAQLDVERLEADRGLTRKGKTSRQSKEAPGDAGEDAYVPNR